MQSIKHAFRFISASFKLALKHTSTPGALANPWHRQSGHPVRLVPANSSGGRFIGPEALGLGPHGAARCLCAV